MMKDRIKVIGFDADDTLWVNEPFYRETEKMFAQLMSEYLDEDEVNKRLFATEMKNLRIYGYGSKGFTLSLIETAITISNHQVSNEIILKIIEFGKSLLQMPIELLEGVEDVLKSLNGSYKLIIATKGDLLNQEHKLERSGLASHFHHIEIMSDKKEANYKKLLNHLEVEPEEFIMIGNSINSDIKPVLNLGSSAIHIPFHTTWIHEVGDLCEIKTDRFKEVKNIKDILALF